MPVSTTFSGGITPQQAAARFRMFGALIAKNVNLEINRACAEDLMLQWRAIGKPIVTGRYMASIGKYDPGWLVKTNRDSGPWDALWRENAFQGAVEIGTNVPYAGSVEDRHGTMAMALRKNARVRKKIAENVMQTVTGSIFN